MGHVGGGSQEIKNVELVLPRVLFSRVDGSGLVSDFVDCSTNRCLQFVCVFLCITSSFLFIVFRQLIYSLFGGAGKISLHSPSEKI